MASTFGAWLPGDPRGFRTRHHREHIEGDYKQPPPKDMYAHRHEYVQDILRQPPVTLSNQARQSALDSILHTLVEVHHIEVLALSVGGQHLHIMARFGAVVKEPTPMRCGLQNTQPVQPTSARRGLRLTDPVRFYMGIAKERSAKALKAQGLVSDGHIWARRGKIVPIKNRTHQIKVYHYILDHVHENAVVWSFRDGIPRDTA